MEQRDIKEGAVSLVEEPYFRFVGARGPADGAPLSHDCILGFPLPWGSGSGRWGSLVGLVGLVVESTLDSPCGDTSFVLHKHTLSFMLRWSFGLLTSH